MRLDARPRSTAVEAGRSTARAADADGVGGETTDARRPSPARRWGLLAAWGIGAAFCTRQYLARPSLWVDELAVVRNLDDRSLRELVTQSLDYDQVAPAGFLVVEKLLGELGGYSELALRVYPLVSALVALALVARLASVLVPGLAATLPPLLLGLSALLIALASQVKQYASDVATMAALLLLAVTASAWRTSARWRGTALLAGALAPWFSQPALFALPALAAALVMDDWSRSRRPARWTILASLTWGASGLASLLAARARVSPETLQYMRDYWHDGFPALPTTWTAIKWWPYSLRMLVADVTNGVGSYLVLALAVLGGVVLWRRSRASAVVLLIPVVGVFAAAAARQYPFMDRLAFFLSPIVVTLVGVAAGALVTRLGGGVAATGATLLAVLAPSVVGLARHLPPYAPQSVRPLLEVMRREVRAGDRVYVPYASWQAWVHYAPRHGLSSLPMVLGSCHYDRRQAYEDEIERLRGGGRTWTLFIPAGLVEDPGLVQRAADARGTLRLVRVERGRDARGKARDVSIFLHDFPPGGAGVLDAPSAGGERTSGEGRARLLTDPPPLPERPSAPECRGAAVPRRLARVPP